MTVRFIKMVAGLFCMMFLWGCGMGGTYLHLTKTSEDLKLDVDDCNKAARDAMARGEIPSMRFDDYLLHIDMCILERHGWQKIEGHTVTQNSEIDGSIAKP